MHFYHNLVFIYKGLNDEGGYLAGKSPTHEKRIEANTA